MEMVSMQCDPLQCPEGFGQFVSANDSARLSEDVKFDILEKSFNWENQKCHR